MSTRQSPDLSGILPAASGDSVRQIDCKTEEEFIMSMIRVENITFSYPSSFDPVFENVSFQIDTEWKLGLVGRNGRGKTTLLKLLLGEYEYRGKITGAVTFDYFPCLSCTKRRSGCCKIHYVRRFCRWIKCVGSGSRSRTGRCDTIQSA